MTQRLSDLSDLDKLLYAVECAERSVPFPTAIVDFLIQEGLYEVIMRPEVKDESSKPKHTTGKQRIRPRIKAKVQAVSANTGIR